MTNKSAPPKLADSRKNEVTHAARSARVLAVNKARRTHVLNAARQAFMEKGLDGASMRAIAKQAGYTVGAIYTYFSSKEDIYGALLEESLAHLTQCVVDASNSASSDASDRLRASANAFFGFYRDNPRDLDLGFYLFQGMKPRGLTPGLNRALNSSLQDALKPLQAALSAMGLSQARTQAELTALFAHIVGILLLNHTGRIRMFKQSAQDLFTDYLEDLLLRAAKRAKDDTMTGSPS